MSEFQVIRLGNRPQDPVEWIVVDSTGTALTAPGTGDLAMAAAGTGGRTVIVLVPATAVLRTRAQVPVKGAAKIQQALPYALEEQLAEDVDDLHFAAGLRGPDGRVPVAVVRRDLMTQWLAQFSAAGLVVSQLYSTSDALGVIPSTTVLLVEESAAILVEPDGSTATIDVESLGAVLELWMGGVAESASDEGIKAPRHLAVHVCAALAERIAPVLDGVRPQLDSLEVRTFGEHGVLPRLAAQIVTVPGLNLLQGDYARRGSLMAYWPAWRLTAALAASLAMVVIATQFAQVRQMQARGATLDRSIDQAFHYLFPDAGEVTDPRGQFESRIRQLGSGGGASREFLDTLQIVAGAIGPDGEARIEALSYRAGVLDLRVRAPNVEAIDKIQQSVAASGKLAAEIQSANASGSEVLGRIQITRAGG
jgi:general secretion pathway protein L